MSARSFVIAATALAIGTAVAAEPPKAPVKDATPQVSHSAPVILASADQVRTPAPAADQANPAPAKHRAARVTTCRCGDQVEEQPDQ